MNLSERAKRMEPSAIRAMSKLAAAAGPELISLSGGVPDPATFPLERLAEVAASEIRDHYGKSLQYGQTAGFRPLLDWICRYISRYNIQSSRVTVMCDTGSQQALEIGRASCR